MQFSITGNRRTVTKTLRTMKLIAILMLATALQASANGFSQKVTLTLKDASIEQMLKEIKKQTGYLYFYKAEELKKSGKISLSVTNAEITETLNRGLQNTPFTFTIVNETIVIQLRNETEVNPPAPVVLSNINVSGKVTDKSGAPLAGANVKVRGTRSGTTTNQNGVFNLNNISETAVLEISFVGYKSQVVNVNNRSDISITLQLADNKLDETVVIAYGKTSKRLNTGSVSSVTSDIIESQPVSDPLAALQGRVSGLMITSSNGLPGSAFQVRIRGENSMKQGNDPLYIIDGVPFISSPLNTFDGANGSQSPLNSISPNDIERIDVLKDADATAIYGSRGANGVILITTKKGTSGQGKFSVNINRGISQMASKFDFLNTDQYLQLRKDAFAYDNRAATSTTAPDLTIWDPNAYTDWQDLIIGNTAQVTNAQASYSGGNAQTGFLLSGNYRKDGTVFIGDKNYTKVGSLLSVSHKSQNRKFALSATVNYTADDNNTIATDLSRYINLAPNMPQKNADGSIYWFGTVQNPLAYLERTYDTKTSNLIANSTLQYNIVKELAIKANVGYTQTSMKQILTLPKAGFNPDSYPGSSSQFGNNDIKSYIVEPQIELNKNLGIGKLNVLAGASLQQRILESRYLQASGFSSDALLRNPGSASSLSIRGGEYNEYKYESFFGRVNYNINQTYLLNATFRRDGSSRFGPGKQFGNFGAIGAAWVFSNEKFIGNKSVISFGKLRGSYGSTGNDQIGDYQFLDTWGSAGFPYGGVSGLTPTRVYNPDYSWEINKKLEVALELGFNKDKQFLTLGYYNNRSSNQLIGYTLSSQSGFSSYTANLPAKVENKGLEIDISSNNISSKNFSWTTSFNLSLPSNKLLEYPGLKESADANSYEVGQSIRMIKGFHFTGVDPQTGVATFLDVNTDNAISSPGDYIVMGETMPQLFGGLNNQVKFKKLTMDIFFQFVKQEAPTIDYGPSIGPFGTTANRGTYVLDYWKKPGDITDIPVPSALSSTASYKAFNSYYRYSDAAWGDASYIRLKNVSISYDLSALTKRWKVEGTTLYVQGQNLITITNYRGLDPEINGFDRRFVYPINPFGSVRPQAMPSLRTFTIGLKFSL